MNTFSLSSDVIQGFVESCLTQSFDNPTRTPQFHKELWDLCCSSHRLVAVAAPRGHAKSTAVTHAYLLANVLFRIRDFVIICSDTETQAKDFLTDIKKELQTNEQLISLFKIKDFTKDTETDIIVDFQDGNQFRIVAKGSEQKVRGMKWNNKRPNLIICDDMENDEIVLNKDRREKFRKWFMGALLPCLAPNGLIRIVGTILHLDSWLARVCPEVGLLNTIEEPLKIYSNNKRAAWKSVIYKAHVGNSPSDIKSDEDILWPARFNKEFFEENYIDKVQQGHPELYAQELLNKPLDEATAYFRKNDFVAITQEERSDIESGKKPLNYYVGVDLAISESERADFCVFTVAATDSNNILYHRDQIKARMDGREIVDHLINFKVRYQEKLQWIVIESEKIEKAIKSFLIEEMHRRGIYFTYIPVNPAKDKWTRAKPLQARMRTGGIKFDKEMDYYPALESEFLQFPRGKHDDQVDALAYICLTLDKMVPANTYREELEEENARLERSANVYRFTRNGRSAISGY